MDPTDPPPPPSDAPEKSPEKNSAPVARVTQKDLATQLGVSPEDMKRLRDEHLAVAVDWIAPLPGQPILYTAAGVARLRAALGLPELLPSADAGTAPSEPLRVTLTVIRPARGCTHIVLCTAPPDTRIVNLRVKAGGSSLFTPGMQVPNCVQHHGVRSLFNFEGRMPRRKGVLR